MFEINSKNIFLFNDELFILIEENLSYFNEEETTVEIIKTSKTSSKKKNAQQIEEETNQRKKSTKQQFNLISMAKISDIVHMRLFKDSETKIEISFVDESSFDTTQQINWLFEFNNNNLLSQLVKQLKEIWEKIFFVEMPINF